MAQQNLGVLFEVYGEACLWYAFSLTKNRYDAEELVSEAFLALLTALPFLEEDGIKFWLFRVIRNRFLDKQRKQSRWQRWFSTQTVEKSVATPLEEVIKDEHYQALYRAIETLRPEDQELIFLHYFADQSLQELALLFDMSYSQTKNRLFRGRQKLKEVLGHEEFPEI